MTQSGVWALAVVLVGILSPGSVVSAAEYLVVSDPVGDLRTPAGEEVGTPEFLDIKRICIELGDRTATISVEVAAEIPSSIGNGPALEYGLLIDWNGAGSWDWHQVVPGLDWAVLATDRSGFSRIAGADVSGNTFAYEVPRPALFANQPVQVRGYMLTMGLPDPSAFASSPEPTSELAPPDWGDLEDRVPNGTEGWAVTTPTGTGSCDYGH